MKKLAVIAIALAMLSSCALRQVKEIKHPHVPNQLIVKLNPGVGPIQLVLEKLNIKYGVLDITKLSGNGTFLLSFPDNTNLARALNDYGKNRNVEYAEPNYTYELIQ